MEIDNQAKQILQELGTAINESVADSGKVAAAIERLREAGYEMELTLRLEIGLRQHRTGREAESVVSLDLTDEDLKVLRAMKIKLDSED